MNLRRVVRRTGIAILLLALAELLSRVSVGSVSWRVWSVVALRPGECKHSLPQVAEALFPTGPDLSTTAAKVRRLFWDFGIHRSETEEECVLLLRPLHPWRLSSPALDGGPIRMAISKETGGIRMDWSSWPRVL